MIPASTSTRGVFVAYPRGRLSTQAEWSTQLAYSHVFVLTLRQFSVQFAFRTGRLDAIFCPTVAIEKPSAPGKRKRVYGVAGYVKA